MFLYNYDIPDIPTKGNELAIFMRNKIVEGWNNLLTAQMKRIHYQKLKDEVKIKQLKNQLSLENLEKTKFKKYESFFTSKNAMSKKIKNLNHANSINEESFRPIERENKNSTSMSPKDALLYTRIFARKFEKDVPYVQLKSYIGKEPSKPYQYRITILPADGSLPDVFYDFDDTILEDLLTIHEAFLFCLPKYIISKDGKEAYKNKHNEVTFKVLFVQ